jgi:hypothetical protein
VRNANDDFEPLAISVSSPCSQIDLEVFREILSNLGFGDITDQDIQTLIDTADIDGDGRVSLAGQWRDCGQPILARIS